MLTPTQERDIRDAIHFLISRRHMYHLSEQGQRLLNRAADHLFDQLHAEAA